MADTRYDAYLEYTEGTRTIAYGDQYFDRRCRHCARFAKWPDSLTLFENKGGGALTDGSPLPTCKRCGPFKPVWLGWVEETV